MNEKRVCVCVCVCVCVWHVKMAICFMASLLPLFCTHSLCWTASQSDLCHKRMRSRFYMLSCLKKKKKKDVDGVRQQSQTFTDALNMQNCWCVYSKKVIVIHYWIYLSVPMLHLSNRFHEMWPIWQTWLFQLTNRRYRKISHHSAENLKGEKIVRLNACS